MVYKDLVTAFKSLYDVQSIVVDAHIGIDPEVVFDAALVAHRAILENGGQLVEGRTIVVPNLDREV